jgi:hypothetical protein
MNKHLVSKIISCISRLSDYGYVVKWVGLKTRCQRRNKPTIQIGHLASPRFFYTEHS